MFLAAAISKLSKSGIIRIAMLVCTVLDQGLSSGVHNWLVVASRHEHLTTLSVDRVLCPIATHPFPPPQLPTDHHCLPHCLLEWTPCEASQSELP